MPSVIFVGGTGRCGTSVVADVLGLSPDSFKLPFELRFLTDPDGIVDYYRSARSGSSPFMRDVKLRRLRALLERVGYRTFLGWTLHSFLQLLPRRQRLFSPPSYAMWGLSRWVPRYRSWLDRMIQALAGTSFRGTWVGHGSGALSTIHCGLDGPHTASVIRLFLSKFFSAVLSRSEAATVFVSDDTWSVMFADTLSKLIPGCRFVHVLRDPADVVSSFTRQRWCPACVEGSLSFYMDVMETILLSLSKVAGNLVYTIRLEDLMNDREKEAKRLATFAEVAFTKDMVSPLDAGRLHKGRWEKDKSITKPVLDALGSLRERLGY